jgi:hypothetical protein
VLSHEEDSALSGFIANAHSHAVDRTGSTTPSQFPATSTMAAAGRIDFWNAAAVISQAEAEAEASSSAM